VRVGHSEVVCEGDWRRIGANYPLCKVFVGFKRCLEELFLMKKFLTNISDHKKKRIY
jgi:hypothetical protein